jgi:hypothetical protein
MIVPIRGGGVGYLRPMRRFPGILIVVVVLLLVAAAPAASSPAVYKLKREGLRVALVVKGNHLVHLRVWARERCSDGSSRAREFNDRGHFPVSPRGLLRYSDSFSTEYGYEETRLRAHVGPAAVKGSFFDIEEEVGYYVCATGHRGDRLLRFTARRAR